LSLSLVDFYYNPKSKPKTSPISLSRLSLNYLYRRSLEA
jgi:hypothetical protein